MGPDKLQYDSTGAGEMVKSHDGEVMGGFAAPGGGCRCLQRFGWACACRWPP